MSYRRLSVEDKVTPITAKLYDNLQDGIDEALEKLTYNETTPISEGKSVELILGTDYDVGDIIKFVYKSEYREYVSITYTTPDGTEDIPLTNCADEYCEIKIAVGEYCLSIATNEYVDVYLMKYKTICDLKEVVDALSEEISKITGGIPPSGEATLQLPPITDDDEGKVLTAMGGKPIWKELQIYDGEYEVVPDITEQSLQTSQKFMEDNVTIKEIPYSETSNTSGGNTVYIGKEL